jgi:hypothetical protein
VVLEYRRLGGAERCPTRADLEAQVSAILGRRPFVQRAPHTVRCTLRGEGDTIAARVELVDSRSGRQLGIRELSGRSCQELGGAVALAIALAIDPLARPPPRLPPPVVSSAAPGAGSAASAGAVVAPPTGSRGLPGSSATPPDAGARSPLASLGLPAAAVALAADAGLTPPAPPDAGRASPDAGPSARDAGGAALLVDGGVDAGIPAPADAGVDAGLGPLPLDAGAPVADESAVADAAAAHSGWLPVVGAGVVVTAGTLPGVAAGVLVHAGAASSTASVELEARWLPGTSQAYGAGSISTSLFTGALVGCARFGPWAACGLTQAGPLSAQGAGFSRSEDASAWLVSVGARGQWEYLFAGPLGVRLHLDGMVNVVRPRFLVDSQVAWTTPPVSVWVGGGLFGRF